MTVMTIATLAMAHAGRDNKVGGNLVQKKVHRSLFGLGAVPIVFNRPIDTPTGILSRKDGRVLFRPARTKEQVKVEALFEKGVVGEPVPGLYYLFSFNPGRQLQRIQKGPNGDYIVISPKIRQQHHVWPSSKERLPSLLPYAQYLELTPYKDVVAADLGDEHVVLASKPHMLDMAVSDGVTARRMILDHFKERFPQNEVNKVVTRPIWKTTPQPIIVYLHDLYFNLQDGNVSWETYRTTHEWQTGEIIEAARVENELSATNPGMIEPFFSLKAPNKPLGEDAARESASAAVSDDR